jgi:hypothetical protein
MLLVLDEAQVLAEPSHSEQSLRRLQDADLVLRRDYGDYQLQDDAFAEWLRNRELEI